MLTLHSLPASGNKKSRRVGRGAGSHRGTYSGRGIKGQRARSGGRGGLKLRGLKQTFLHVPKMKGMKPRFESAQVVTLAQLEKVAKAGDVVTATYLLEKGLIMDAEARIKVLSDGTLTKKLEVAVRASDSARSAIEAAGGTVAGAVKRTGKRAKR